MGREFSLREFLTLSGTVSILSGLKSEQQPQKQWLELAQRIKKRCQVWLVPCIQVVLSKLKEPIQAKAALGLQHFIRSFATSLFGTKAILCFHSETLQPLTEVILNEGEGQKTFRVVGIVSYKDFRDEPAPKRVDLTCIVGGWTWTLKMDFEWHAKKVWLLKQGEGWGEFLEPGLTKCEVEVSDVQVDEPVPDELFEVR